MDDSSAAISIEELRVVTERILAAVERRFGPTIELGTGDYWSIFPSDAFNLEVQAPVGASNVQDDVETLRDRLGRSDQDQDDDDMLWHDLDHLAGLLSRLSYLAGA